MSEVTSEICENNASVPLPAQPATKGTVHLYLATISACLGSFTAGCAMGYSSPADPQLTDTTRSDAQLILNENERSWFDGILSIGAVIGGLIGGGIVGFLGYRISLMLTTLPYIVGWLLVTYSFNLVMALIARVLIGIGIGMSSLIVPIFIADLSPPSLRGKLGSFFQLFLVTGILFVFVVGTYTSWQWLAIICVCVPIAMLVLMMFMPEAPRWLLRNNRREEAIKCLKWLRKSDHNVENECDELQKFLQEEQKISFTELLQPALFKPVLISVLTMIFQQFSGVNAVTFNTKSIFSAAMPSFDSNLASIIMAITQVVATLSSVFLIERFGRKILLLASGTVMGTMCVLFGIFYYFFQSENKASWLPLFCIIIYIVSFSCGYGPVPWVVMAEFVPGRAKGIASGLAVIANWTSVFCTTKEFIDMEHAMQDYGTFWFFGAVCFTGVLFVWKIVPETKGRTLEEISSFFTKNKTVPV